MLALWTEMGPATPNHNFPDPRPAYQTPLATALVHLVLKLEKAFHPVRIHVVGDRGAAQRDGVEKNLLERLVKPFQFTLPEPRGHSARTYASAKQALVGIDIPNPVQQALVEQGRFDRRASQAKKPDKVRHRDRQRLASRTGERRVPAKIAQFESAKASWIDEANLASIGQGKPSVGVVGERRAWGGHKQPPRHPEMDDPLGNYRGTLGSCGLVRVPHKIADNVFPYPVDALDPPVFEAQSLFDRAGFHGFRVRAKPYLGDAFAVDPVMHTASDGLDFGQLGHGAILSPGAAFPAAYSERYIMSLARVRRGVPRPCRRTWETSAQCRPCTAHNAGHAQHGSDIRMRAKTAVVLGAQWGDEGKGKIVDVLSGGFAAVARYAGGHNAGHTVIIHGQKFVLQLIPCGVLRPGCKGVIGNGVVLDPIAFLREVDKLRALGIDVDSQLFVSNRAQVILPYHRMIELAAESAPGRQKIGTTSRGIGPAYEDKMARSGLRIVDLLNTRILQTHIENACQEKNAIAHALFGSAPIDPAQMFDEYAAAAERVRPFVTDTGRLLSQVIANGGSVMFEGAQGTMLDIDHGTYPFVTSSSATAGGAATGTGVGPTAIGTVIGVTKAYVTRVGEGPFPTEIHDDSAEALRARGNEYGAVTGRPRRCGWLDIPLLRYSNQVNGTEWLVVTKMDVLDELAEIPVCVGYEIDGKFTDQIPADVQGLESIVPRYTTLKGWRESTEGIREFDRLPQAAQEYLRFQERESGAQIGMVSTGPDRDQTMILPEFAAVLASLSA